MSEIGMYLKRIRGKTGDSLRIMAAKLKMSAAYLSAIEGGKRNIPENFFSLLCEVYTFDEKEREELRNAILASTSNYKIDLSTLCDKKRKLLFTLAEGEIDEEVVDKLCEVVDENKNKSMKL